MTPRHLTNDSLQQLQSSLLAIQLDLQQVPATDWRSVWYLVQAGGDDVIIFGDDDGGALRIEPVVSRVPFSTPLSACM